MDLTQIETLEERQILEEMLKHEQENLPPGKMFDIASLTRILKKVPREVAIGAIIASGLYERKRLEQDLDDMLNLIFDVMLPNFIYELLREAVPEFIADLKTLLLVFIFRWLYKLPGDMLQLEVEETLVVPLDPPPTEGAEAKRTVEKIRKAVRSIKEHIEERYDPSIQNTSRGVYFAQGALAAEKYSRAQLYVKLNLYRTEEEKDGT